MVSEQLPPEENCPPVRVGVWVKVRVSLGLGGNQTIAPEDNQPPVRVRVWLRVSFAVGRQYSLGAIVLEPLIIVHQTYPSRHLNVQSQQQKY